MSSTGSRILAAVAAKLGEQKYGKGDPKNYLVGAVDQKPTLTASTTVGLASGSKM